MADSDLMQLYSRRILALTTAIPHQGRLATPEASASKRSPHCGSSVTVDLVLSDGAISEFAQQVRACALGQASAAVLGGAIIGRTRHDMIVARDQLRAMLKQEGPAPAAPFADLEALLPAKDYPNRHASILLAWDATIEAMDSALAAA
ncbi:iron-sulfur cluster assembly scaffold protein [Paracoccus sp. Z330]|uniref:Iron-sulfur cluster assembly scaffold protein n=1 Tax=Paracoccus onchidii TaxID=3017813 RepID=A0ABT4ZGR0_9RHOB|nr:iron-sulfur cluster assembly scaffold protein [Paracoccus onchidii]MDB6178554.1 iron-sulfur cluster assembly scaffold protein [Paracoccus onchidii]